MTSSMARGTLIFMCGKMAAGKSTLARELASREEAILFVQDELLDRLYPGEIQDLADFVRCSSRLREALSPVIEQLLQKGSTVVLDFPGTPENSALGSAASLRIPKPRMPFTSWTRRTHCASGS